MIDPNLKVTKEITLSLLHAARLYASSHQDIQNLALQFFSKDELESTLKENLEIALPKYSAGVILYEYTKPFVYIIKSSKYYIQPYWSFPKGCLRLMTTKIDILENKVLYPDYPLEIITSEDKDPRKLLLTLNLLLGSRFSVVSDLQDLLKYREQYIQAQTEDFECLVSDYIEKQKEIQSKLEGFQKLSPDEKFYSSLFKDQSNFKAQEGTSGT